MKPASRRTMSPLNEIERIDAELKKVLERYSHGECANMYRMLRYFMGYLESDLKKKSEPRGKRFRPMLTLHLGRAYGVEEKVFDAALAIELFHNFTLIHDDIEDGDDMRRGRPTVWKLWGINHAINSADAQSLIACGLCAEIAGMGGSGPSQAKAMITAFISVCEGQYLDFELTSARLDNASVRIATYLRMARKKAGALIGVSAEVSGIAGGRSKSERHLLRSFGEYFGVSYQIADDYRSIWGKETGKMPYGDLRERKRSFPIIAAFSKTHGRAQTRLAELFHRDRPLADLEVIEAAALIDATDAEVLTRDAIKSHFNRALKALRRLSIPESSKKEMELRMHTLIPEYARAESRS